MRKDKIISLEESNKKISEIIETKKSFSITRVGLGGGTAITALTIANQPIHPEFLKMFYHNEGFYGVPDFGRFVNLYGGSIRESDLQGYWGDPCFPGFMEYEDFITPKDQVLIEPSSLDSYIFDNPWSSKLKGKKILIVSSFKDSIEKQLKIKDKIWNGREVLPDAEYIVYKPVQSMGGYGPHTSWYESFDIMCRDISKIDFDVALLACGGYGVPLCWFIKNQLSKGAIYVGGCLQIFFGIKGRRWDNSENVTKHYNEHWIRPSAEEKPKIADQIEGGCYW